MPYTLNTFLQNILVDCLRDAFLSNSDYPLIMNGNYIDLENTSIAIYRQYPNVLQSYPEICVNPPRIGEIPKTLGNNFISATYGDVGGGMSGLCGETYGGMSGGSFTIQISADTEPERDLLADIIMGYLNFSHKWFLEKKAIEVTGVSKQGERVIPRGENYIYITEVSCDIWGEWSSVRWYSGDILENVANCNVWISGVDGLPGLSNI